MSQYEFDLFVIGGGSGGVRAARIAANLGARVAVVEERYLGGTCVNVGCVPKKLLVYGSEYGTAFADAQGFGWNVGKPTLDWPRVIANKDREIARLKTVYRNLLVNAGVTVIEGRGTIVDPHGVSVNGRRHTAERVLIATGGWPFIPEIPGKSHYATSNELFHLPSLPERIVIGGGGYIAVEFAGIFRGFGAEVHQIYRGPLFLRGFDQDVREFLAEEMTKRGIQLCFHTTIARIDKVADHYKAHLSDGRVIEADLVVAATGRVPMTANLGLEAVGVKLGKTGGVIVNDAFQTNVPSIYAVGDVLDNVKLTPVALAEGMLLARNLYGGGDGKIDYTNIPTAVFSQPNIGTVGLTEQEARQQYGRVQIFKSSFRPMRHTMSGRDERTMMKLIVDAQTDKVLGCHMVGPDAGEITQGLGIALKCGATKAQFDATIGIHPTAAEEFVTMRTPEPEQAGQAAGA